MLKISEVVEDLIENDDLVKNVGLKGFLNLSAYARSIQKDIEKALLKKVKEGSIIIALKRYLEKQEGSFQPISKVIQRLSVHSNVEGLTVERTDTLSQTIGQTYQKLKIDSKSFFTVTQGINEITIVAEKSIMDAFRKILKKTKKIYDKSDLVGITVKFDLKYLEIPNIVFELNKRIALKNINIVEIISTATEITFIIEKRSLQSALEALQKNLL